VLFWLHLSANRVHLPILTLSNGLVLEDVDWTTEPSAAWSGVRRVEVRRSTWLVPFLQSVSYKRTTLAKRICMSENDFIWNILYLRYSFFRFVSAIAVPLTG
jgi:hypothetical protein